MNLKSTSLLLTFVFLFSSTITWSQSQTSLDIALRYIEQNYKVWNLTQADIAEMVVSDIYQSQKSGLTHVYFRQKHDGIALQNAILNVNITQEGEVLYVGKRFQADVQSQVTATDYNLTADDALQVVFNDLNISEQLPRAVKTDSEYKFKYYNKSVAKFGISAELTYKKVETGIALVWKIVINPAGNIDMWGYHIDALTGQIIEKEDLLIHCSFEKGQYHNHDAHCRAENIVQKEEPTVKEALTQMNSAAVAGSYRVFAIPTESPDHGDHVIVTDPDDLVASPYGWHDKNGEPGPEYFYTRGNNVHAFQDRDGDGISADDEPNGTGLLNFDFPYMSDGEAADNTDAATVNLFYMSNIMHDFSYVNGFDEVAGNFQSNTYGNGGIGSDNVFAIVQSGADVGQEDDAVFTPSVDGDTSTISMFVWNDPGGGNFNVIEPATVAGQYNSLDADFGAPITDVPVTAEVVEVDDAVFDPYTTDACEDLVNAADLVGKIALIDRGGCEFGSKSLRAQNAGAVGVIICNFDPDPIVMGGGVDGGSVTIPVVMIGVDDCSLIRNFESNGLTVTLVTPPANTGPDFLDGAFDNGIIAHEYTHGISNRLTGGPSVADCLGNEEEMGEGWSDFFALAITAKPGDTGDMRRGVGTYLSRVDIDQAGMRDFPYSTDMGINPRTFLNSNSFDEYVRGEVWSSMLWDMYWALVDEYGFDADLINGTGGNNMAVQLVMDGMKIQPCNPGFIDARDAILAADQALNGGANECLIWEVFARRGLGYSADQGSTTDANDQTEAFDPLPICIPELKISKSVSPFIQPGDEIDVSVIVINHKPETLTGIIVTDQLDAGTAYVTGSCSLGDGVVTDNGSTITFDLGTMEYLAEIPFTYKISTDPDNSSIRHFYEDMEDVDVGLWFPIPVTGDNFWALTDIEANSGDMSYYVENTIEETQQILQVGTPSDKLLIQGDNPVLRIYHNFNTEGGADGGVIQFSTDDGATWQEIADHLFRNPYTPIQYGTFIIPNFSAFSGNSDGWISSYADMSAWAGQEVIMRFHFRSDDNTAPDTEPAGWFIDDVELMDMLFYDTEICVTSDQGDQACDNAPSRGTIVESEIVSNTIDPVERVFVKIFPNPTDNQINLAISSLENEEVRISLVTLDGREVISTSVETSNMTQTFNLNVANLPGGFYFVKVATDKGLKVEKIVIH